MKCKVEFGLMSQEELENWKKVNKKKWVHYRDREAYDNFKTYIKIPCNIF